MGALPRWSLAPFEVESVTRPARDERPSNNGVSPGGFPPKGFRKRCLPVRRWGNRWTRKPDGAFENVPTFPVPEHMDRPRRIHRLGRAPSFPINIRATETDVAISRGIARHTAPVPEEIARMLTWGADEKLLLVLASIGWLASRGCREPLRRAGNHALLVTVSASLLPHGLKRLFNQTRPDRRTVVGHVHGIPFSGEREDAFPSGHALHMGALASAAGALPAGPRRVIRTLAIGLSLTRVVVLAHWASDVIVGFALGAVLERTLRLWTGYPAFKEDDHADS